MVITHNHRVYVVRSEAELIVFLRMAKAKAA